MADYQPTLDSGAFLNRANAHDGNSTTFSGGTSYDASVSSTWYGFSSLSLTGATLTLKVDRNVYIDDPIDVAMNYGGTFIAGTAGTTNLYYSLDGGSTWASFDYVDYAVSGERLTTNYTLSGATLSGKNLSNLRIQASVAGGSSTFNADGMDNTVGTLAELDIYEITATVITAQGRVSCDPFMFF